MLLKVVASSVGIGCVDGLPCSFHAHMRVVDYVETVQVLSWYFCHIDMGLIWRSTRKYCAGTDPDLLWFVPTDLET